MPTAKLLTRLEILEQRVTVLEWLPAKVDALAAQIVQLRDEMRAEFSAIRVEMRTGDLATQASLREEIRAGDEETRRVLREEIRASENLMRELIGETRAHMLVLHEDLVERIKRIGEALAPAAQPGHTGGEAGPPPPRTRRRRRS